MYKVYKILPEGNRLICRFWSAVALAEYLPAVLATYSSLLIEHCDE